MYLLLCKMPSRKERDDDDFIPSGGAAARGAKKHPVTEAVLRFATEKRGPKAGPFVNKVFEQSIEGAEEEATTIEGDDDDARAAPIANMLMLIVAWLYYYIKLEFRRTLSQSHRRCHHHCTPNRPRPRGKPLCLQE